MIRARLGCMKRRLTVLTAVGAVSTAPMTLRARGPDRGVISGTVLDPVGSPAGKVGVQARNADGQTIRRAATEGSGRYTLTDLPPGSYDLFVTIPGLKGFE